MAIGLLCPEERVRRLFSSHSAWIYCQREKAEGLSLSFKRLNGLRTIARLRVEGFRGLSIQGDCAEGRYQIVAVSKERTVLLYDSSLPNEPVPALSSGLYRIRLLAEKTTGSLLLKNLR